MELSSPVFRIFERLYRALLRVYSRPHRQRFSDEMAQVFRDMCRDIYARRGLAGLTWLWLSVVADLLKTAFEERLRHKTPLTRERFIRLSGWGLMAGGILFAIGLIVGSFDSEWSDPIGGVDAFYEFTQLVGIGLGQILFVIGLLGLRAGYASRSGRLGAVLLLAALIGGLVSLGGMLAINSADAGWYLWMFGLLTMSMALTGYGVVAIRRRVFSRWNFAPLLAGVMLPALFGITIAIESSGGNLGDWVLPIGVATTSVGLILLGFRMQADAITVEVPA